MTAGDLHYLGLVETSERIRRRELSSEEVTRALIARIERLDVRLNCVLRLMAESALIDAKRGALRQNKSRRPANESPP